MDSCFLDEMNSAFVLKFVCLETALVLKILEIPILKPANFQHEDTGSPR